MKAFLFGLARTAFTFIKTHAVLSACVATAVVATSVAAPLAISKISEEPSPSSQKPSTSDNSSVPSSFGDPSDTVSSEEGSNNEVSSNMSSSSESSSETKSPEHKSSASTTTIETPAIDNSITTFEEGKKQQKAKVAEYLKEHGIDPSTAGETGELCHCGKKYWNRNKYGLGNPGSLDDYENSGYCYGTCGIVLG